MHSRGFTIHTYNKWKTVVHMNIVQVYLYTDSLIFVTYQTGLYFYCTEQLHLSNINFDFAANEMIYFHRIFLKSSHCLNL